MKTLRSCALSLCFAGSAVITPCLAQDAPSAPEVHVDTSVVTKPEFHVDTTVITTPDVHVHTHGDNPFSDKSFKVEIVVDPQTGKTTKKLLLDTTYAQALKNYTVAQVYQNLSTMYTPEMAKKTRDIALLRQMLSLNLTQRDIEQALPLLRELKNSDKAVPAKPDQALDEEYNQLLRARPGDPMPSSSAEALRDAASGFRSRKQAIWDKMAQLIGRTKATGIRGMVRSESTSGWSGSTFQNLFTAPNAFAPPQAPVRPRTAPRLRPAPAQPADPPVAPDGPVSAKPADGDEIGARAARSGRDRAAAEAAIGLQDSKAEGAARSARSRTASPAVVQADPDDEKATEETARQREREARRARTQGGNVTTPQSGTAVAPLGRALTIDGNGRRLVYGFYGQASVDELIDLFERKLAAMRH